MAKCVSAAQNEQRDSARLWTSMKGPFGSVVATLKRMQWTILEHSPLLWCMQDGRIVDPRRVCPRSMHILLKKAARAWQWRRVALREGCEGLDRGAVFAPRSAALHSPLLSTPSVIVDGQWTQLRKHRAVRTLAAMCALSGSEEGSLIHRHIRCSEVPDVEPCNTWPFSLGGHIGQVVGARVFRITSAAASAQRAPPGDAQCLTKTRWQGDRSLITGVIYGDGSAHAGQDAGGWQLKTGACQPVTVSGTLPFLIQDVDEAQLFGLFMFLRIAHASAQYVTDSSFAEEGANQRGRTAC